MKRKSNSIAIIGASYLQLPLVKKAREKGLRVLCFAWEKGAVCAPLCDEFYPISVLDKDAILKVLQGKEIDGIVSIASDIVVPTVTYVAEALGLSGNTYESSLMCTNKYYMRNALDEAGLPMPEYALLNSPISRVPENLSLPVVVKPVDRSGSLGVNKVEDERNLFDATTLALSSSLSKNAIIEQFVEGTEYSVEALTYDGKHSIISFTEKATSGFPHYVELAHHQPAKDSEALAMKYGEVIRKALSTLGINFGPSHTEIMISKDGKVSIIEVGARMGGDFIGSHLVELSTGFDYLGATLDIAMGVAPSMNFGKSMFSGVYFASKLTAHISDLIRNKEDFPFIVEANFLSLPTETLTASSDRYGYIVYQASQKIIL